MLGLLEAHPFSNAIEYWASSKVLTRTSPGVHPVAAECMVSPAKTPTHPPCNRHDKPRNTVVNQEALRFNKLLLRVRASLVDIGRLSECLLEFVISCLHMLFFKGRLIEPWVSSHLFLRSEA